MAKICTSVTTWVMTDVLSPVDKWVTEQQKKCQQYPWWDPRGLFCWLVTVTVWATVWIIKQVLTPVYHTICIVITGVIGVTLLPFGAAVDAVCAKCNATVWIKLWFLTPTKVTCENKGVSAANPKLFNYVCVCLCRLINPVTIEIAAGNDDEAAALAKAECEDRCA